MENLIVPKVEFEIKFDPNKDSLKYMRNHEITKFILSGKHWFSKKIEFLGYIVEYTRRLNRELEEEVDIEIYPVIVNDITNKNIIAKILRFFIRD